MKLKRDRWIILGLGFIGMILIFILSWQTNPNLKGSIFIPSWIYQWTDRMENATVRTGVPFLVLALFIGIWFCIRDVKDILFLYVWIALFIVVTIAEVGQHFIPSRSFDLRDIFWGTLGSSLGLGTTYLLLLTIRVLKD